MEGELDLENILGEEDIENLFSEESTSKETSEKTEENQQQETQKETPITEVDVNNLFEIPESVSNEEENNNQEEGEISESNKESSTSQNNFYSSIAKALKEDGIFPDLDDSIANKIKAPEDFAEVVENQIKSKLDDRQQRIDRALNVGVEDSEINKYETALNYLDSLKDSDINDEGDKGENLRKQLIYQDFINRGYTKERAEREITKSFNAGTDLEDAKEALSSNKEYFKNSYDLLIEEAEEFAEKEREIIKEQAEALKKSILEESTLFGDINIDKSIRQKAFEAISKPKYKDPDSGELYTELQKYEKENKKEFLKNISLFFTITDGFKNIDKIVKTKVNKEMKKGIKELEHTLNNTSRNSDGSLKFVSGVNDDPESFFSKGWTIDV